MIDMKKEMPEWLKGYYNRLWEMHKEEAFTFKVAMEELNLSKKMATKTLLELERRGFLNKERSPIDYRARVYRLISPDDIKFVLGLYSLVEKKKLEKQRLVDKLVFIDGKLPYVITGSFAAYHYHHYINPPKVIEIKIHLQDEGKWIAFLTDEKTAVFIGDVIESRKIENYIKLLHSTRAIDTIRTKTKEGYYTEKPEFLIIELLERGAQSSIIEAIAIVVTNKTSLLWSGSTGLPRLAKQFGVSRRLGFLLDAINLEARRKIIKPEIIAQIKKDVTGKVDEIFPRDEVALSRLTELRNKLAHRALLTKEEQSELNKLMERLRGYENFNEKWGMQIMLPRDVIRKVLEDLGVKLAKR